MTTNTAPAPKLSLSQRRSALLETLLDVYNGEIRASIVAGSQETVVMGLDYWKGRAELMAELGAPLGRTDRWKAAVRFAKDEIAAKGDELTEDFARWAVIQGIIFAGHAA